MKTKITENTFGMSWLEDGKIHTSNRKIDAFGHDDFSQIDHLRFPTYWTDKMYGAHSAPTGGKIKDYTPMQKSIVYLTEEGELFAIGENTHGNLGSDKKSMSEFKQPNEHSNAPQYLHKPISLPKNEKVKTLHSFSNTLLILTESGNVYGMGEGVRGELGTGKKTNRTTWTKAALPSGAKVKRLSTAGYHAVAQTTENTFIGWGKNSKHDLAFTDRKNKPTPKLLDAQHVDAATKIDAIDNGIVIYTNDAAHILQNGKPSTIKKSEVPMENISVYDMSKDPLSTYTIIADKHEDGDTFYQLEAFKDNSINKKIKIPSHISPPIRVMSSNIGGNKIGMSDKEGNPYIFNNKWEGGQPISLDVERTMRAGIAMNGHPFNYPEKFISSMIC